MSRESAEDFNRSIAELARTEPGLVEVAKRMLELRLEGWSEDDIKGDADLSLVPEDDSALASRAVEMLLESMNKVDALWRRFGMLEDAWGSVESREAGLELQSMIDAYLTLDSSDEAFLDMQHDEILDQKIRFADAVIEKWLKERIVYAYEDTQGEKIIRLLAGKAIRLTPLTETRVRQVLRSGASPDELFAQGYLASVSVSPDEVSIGISDDAEGKGPVTEAIVWTRDHAGNIEQQESLEIVET